MEMTAVDQREWSAARTEAVNWFQHPRWELGGRVRPIVYARREDDTLHEALTSLMSGLQQMPGCGVVDSGGVP